MVDYSKMTVAQLREYCRKRGLVERGLKKNELIDLLQSHSDKKVIENVKSDTSDRLSKIKDRMERFRCKEGDQTIPQSLAEDLVTLEKIQARKNRFASQKK
ncbi:hypothetical protein M153_18604000332 [Pseudoloma neurophilia]|uniref:SAP domain-containing protein n=1 Tax=Pseudoloma neurophilia TaxID=146866 RepID=A0A0R0LZV4_9MICR|nr:hypothetical protein M153_18604000332 [Pseudoloma neurophilia]